MRLTLRTGVIDNVGLPFAQIGGRIENNSIETRCMSITDKAVIVGAVLSVLILAGCEKGEENQAAQRTPPDASISATPPKQLQGGNITSVTASSHYGNLDSYKAENAFDGNETTVWAASGGDPAKMTIIPSRPGTLESIKFLSRRTILMEQWKKLHVELYLNGQKASEEEFSFPNAATQPVQEVSLKPVESDKIELYFSEPVMKTPNGVEVSAVSPGYAEITLKWKQ